MHAPPDANNPVARDPSICTNCQRTFTQSVEQSPASTVVACGGAGCLTAALSVGLSPVTGIGPAAAMAISGVPCYWMAGCGLGNVLSSNSNHNRVHSSTAR
eukprot:3933573-Rhodomonas_salina.1